MRYINKFPWLKSRVENITIRFLCLFIVLENSTGGQRTAAEPLGPISVNVSVESASTRSHRTGIRGHRGLLTTVAGGGHKRHHHHHHHHHKRHRDNRSEKVPAVDNISPTSINNNNNNNDKNNNDGGGDDDVTESDKKRPPADGASLTPPAQPLAQLPLQLTATASPQPHHAATTPAPVSQPVPLVAPSLFSLFLNAPLLQPHTQWLYSQLYPNPYLSHLRNTMIFDNESTAAAMAAAAAQKNVDGGVLQDEDTSAVENESPKKSPAPPLLSNDDDGCGEDASPISPKTNAKQTDVWRPYWCVSALSVCHRPIVTVISKLY